MNMNLNLDRNLIISIVIGAVLLVAGVYFLIVVPSTTPVLSSSEPASPDQVTFENLAQQLTPVALDTSVLSDPRFTSLVDIHTAIVPESSGRRDPFAPLSR
jgi:hypothetical protein